MTDDLKYKITSSLMDIVDKCKDDYSFYLKKFGENGYMTKSSQEKLQDALNTLNQFNEEMNS